MTIGRAHDTTVHLVYPAGHAVSCPQAIGRNLVGHLGQRYRVRQYEWDEMRVIRPGPRDVLVGHPHPAPWTAFRMSSLFPGWKRVIALAPYSHGLPEIAAFLDGVLNRCDLFLAITGPYWFRTVTDSVFAHWAPKMVHVDLAVDRTDFPRIKESFAPVGARRFLYIGRGGAYKNTDYLSRIATLMPGSEFGWIGAAEPPIARLNPLGSQDFSTGQGRVLVAGYDFLLTVGRSDPNPTTILEAMAWGLIPVCTPQSGYEGEPGIVNVPLDDVEGAVRVLTELQHAPESHLLAMRQVNDRALDTRFTWKRFCQQVASAIDSSESPPLQRTGRGARAALAISTWKSPFAPWRPSNAAALLRTNATRWARRTMHALAGAHDRDAR